MPKCWVFCLLGWFILSVCCFSFFPVFYGKLELLPFPALLCVCPVNHCWAWARGTRKPFPAVAMALSSGSGFESPRLEREGEGGVCLSMFPQGRGVPPLPSPRRALWGCGLPPPVTPPKAVPKQGSQRPQPRCCAGGGRGCPSTAPQTGADTALLRKKKWETVKNDK